MPYNKSSLAAMTATSEEYIDIEDAVQRLKVSKRTVERLVEEYAKKLKKSRRSHGRKILYQWADVLQCAKIHTGIEKENVPSVAIRRAYTKQYAKELEAENERLKNEVDVLRQEASDGRNPTVITRSTIAQNRQ
jgi:transposase-like protein